MRVIINQSTGLGAKTGVGHYTHQLLRAMREIAAADTFDVFPPAWWGKVRKLGISLRPGRRSVRGEAGRTTDGSWKAAVSDHLRNLSDRALAGYLLLAHGWRPYDLYHEPNYIPLPSSIPAIATMHDLSVLLHPQWHPADRVAFYERGFHQGIKQCRHLVAVSEFTRQEVIRVLNVSPQQITTTRLGIRPGLQPLAAETIAGTVRRLGLPEQYLLYVGTIEPRKNPMLLMRAYGDLPAAVRGRCPLVLAGGWGWNAAEFAEHYEREARHQGVIHLGYVADQDLSVLYGGARALVFPSFYEGFGLPPLEMMACGGAVLASTAESVVEIVGSKAHLLSPHDLEGWRDAMQRIIMDDDWRRELRSGVTELAQTYSWERCARQTLAVYRDVLGAGEARVLRRAG